MKLYFVLACLLAAVNADKSKKIIKPRSTGGRIINGHDAAISEAPYMVSLWYERHFCGGSIISEHWVLTAGHCLTLNKLFNVVAGVHKRSDLSNTQIRKIKSKKCYVRHEHCCTGFHNNDIGLIYVKKRFKLHNPAHVNKISLPEGGYPVTGTGKVYGWGEDNSGLLSDILKVLDVMIYNHKTCKTKFPVINFFDHTLCTHKAGTPDGTCIGDSGGPLVRNTNIGLQLVGVSSWEVKPCMERNMPSVYMSTSYFKEWILTTMNEFQVPDEC